MMAALQHDVLPDRPAAPEPSGRRKAKPRRAILIHNPNAGMVLRRMRDAVAAFASQGLTLEIQHTAGRGDAWRMAREAPQDVWAILVAGGDGTFNEAVNGLMQRPPPRPALGLLPCGTANVLARELGLPLRADKAAQALIGAEAQPIHLGRVDGRYFTVMAGVGMDAQVVAGLSPAMKRHLGRVGYTIETLRQMFFHSPPTLQVTADGQDYRAHSLIAANGRYYGGGFQVTPNARATRRGLDLCLMQGEGCWRVFAQTASVILGTHLKRRDMPIVSSAQQIRVEGPQGAPVQADGELAARLPVTIDAPADWIQVLMPPGPAAPGEARPGMRLMFSPPQAKDPDR
jgi:YegS/Rv2252/BmrU family lipid kinase